ncbi:MAG: c-type cytochrome [Desulfobacterales bacterium]
MGRKNRYAIIVIALLGVTVALSACDYGRMWETPAVRPHEEPILPTEPGIVPIDGGEAVYRAMSVYVLKSPLAKNNAGDIEAGKKLYFTYCAQCHGKNHDGNGTVGQSFQPLPRDLRLSKVQAMSNGRLFKNISYGTPKGRQPPLATTIAVPDRWRIIAYVKSLGVRK